MIEFSDFRQEYIDTTQDIERRHGADWFDRFAPALEQFNKTNRCSITADTQLRAVREDLRGPLLALLKLSMTC